MKGETAALSVRAQRCQSHYFSTIPRIDDSLHRVTNTRCRIDTLFSPDDEHIVARNM